MKVVRTQQSVYSVKLKISPPKCLRNVLCVGRIYYKKTKKVIVLKTAKYVHKRNVPNVNLGFSWKIKTQLVLVVQMCFVLIAIKFLAQSANQRPRF